MIRDVLNGEMYVAQLIKISERARTIAFQYLGVAGAEHQLDKLRDPHILEYLAGKLDCPEEEVFERLGMKIRDAFQQRSLPPFTRFHLQLLEEDKLLTHLASLLRCGPDDALDNLFVANRVKQTLKRIKPELASTTPFDTAALLRVICAKHVVTVVEQRYGIDFTHWGELIAEERWLSDRAKEYLRGHATRLEWPADDPLGILAAFLEEPQPGKAEQQTEDSQVFDAMGLTYLRQRLLFLVSQLREQAVKYAQDASKLDPGQTAFSHLVAWIEVYEQGAITRAMPYLTPHKKPLRTLIPTIFKHSKRLEGKVDPKKPFVMEDVHTYYTRKEQFANFKISCYLQGDDRPHRIVDCNGLPYADYEHLRKVLPQINGRNLSEVGKNITDRLENTLVPVRNPFITSLYNGVNALGPAFAQCLVLCGTPLPITLEELPGSLDLSNKLPYMPFDSSEDTEFPKDVGRIVNEIQSSYRKQGRLLSIVE